MAVISKGIGLFYKGGSVASWKELTNLQEIPDLGGDIDSIEITTLADGAHMYTEGIKNYGDSIDFKFLYDNAQFMELNGITSGVEWKVELPDDTVVEFSGKPSVKLDGVGVNAVLTYTLSVRPTTEFDFKSE